MKALVGLVCILAANGCTMRHGVQLGAVDGSEELGGYFLQSTNSRLQLGSSNGRSCHGGSWWLSAFRQGGENWSEGWILCDGGETGRWALRKPQAGDPFQSGVHVAEASIGKKMFSGEWGIGVSTAAPAEARK
ncbi:hypothetical protein [Amaricoccus macauensis]|uniref:hypothetical protein n=1 Tax=Amaricoccus macauensis TaxID=57001 RepID=UPI003C7DB89B